MKAESYSKVLTVEIHCICRFKSCLTLLFISNDSISLYIKKRLSAWSMERKLMQINNEKLHYMYKEENSINKCYHSVVSQHTDVLWLFKNGENSPFNEAILTDARRDKFPLIYKFHIYACFLLWCGHSLDLNWLVKYSKLNVLK